MNFVMNPLKTVALLTGVLLAGFTLVMPSAVQADEEALVLNPGFQPNPTIRTGVSGGSRSVVCYTTESQGRTQIRTYVEAENAPNAVVQLPRALNNLRISVQARDDLALVIEGPDGNYCSDDADGLMPAIIGNWPAGTYKVWVGDSVSDRKGAYPYQLLFTQE
jgi:hypothetical protein